VRYIRGNFLRTESGVFVGPFCRKTTRMRCRPQPVYLSAGFFCGSFAEREQCFYRTLLPNESGIFFMALLRKDILTALPPAASVLMCRALLRTECGVCVGLFCGKNTLYVLYSCAERGRCIGRAV